MKKLFCFILLGVSFFTLAACTDHSHDGTYVMYQHVSKTTFQLFEDNTFKIDGEEYKGDGYSGTFDYSKNIEKSTDKQEKDTPIEFQENGDVLVFIDPDHPNSTNNYHRNFFVKKNSEYYKHIKDNLANQYEEEKY